MENLQYAGAQDQRIVWTNGHTQPAFGALFSIQYEFGHGHDESHPRRGATDYNKDKVGSVSRPEFRESSVSGLDPKRLETVTVEKEQPAPILIETHIRVGLVPFHHGIVL